MDTDSLPNPKADWLCQRDLAQFLAISEHTASVWAAAGRFRQYEHGMSNCGRRKYSRSLLERELTCRWEAAVRNQDVALGDAQP